MPLVAKSKERKRIRRALIERQGGFYCFYCERPLVEPPSVEGGGKGTVISHRGRIRYATVDHIKPRYKGGTDRLDNLLLVCVQCHYERHKKDEDPRDARR